MKIILQYKYYLLTFFLLGIAVYVQTFFNGFVWDDQMFIVNNVQLHQFSTSIFFDNLLNTGRMYRQILVIWYVLLYSLFGNNAAPYHFLQLMLHILNTTLIFFLFKKYFKIYVSFILSLIFLVHPINAETVLWISSTQTILSTAFGLIAVLLSHREKLTKQQLVIIGVLLFTCLLTYELGIIYFILVLIVLINKKSQLLIKYLYMLAIIFIVYIMLRTVGNALSTVPIASNQEMTTFAYKILSIPLIILYYFKTVIFPKDLIIWQFWSVKEFSFINVILPVIVLQIIFTFYLWCMQKASKKKINEISIFSALFFVGFLPTMQIFQLDMTVADRWFYIPFIGLLGILGIIYSTFSKQIIKYKILVIALLIILISGYSIRTYVRSLDWKNDLTLYSHDIVYQPNHIELNYNLAIIYENQQSHDKALPYIKKVENLALHNPKYSDKIVTLANIYMSHGNYNEATNYYTIALENHNIKRFFNNRDIYSDLAFCLIQENKFSETIRLLDKDSIEISPFKYYLLYFRALSYYHIKNYEAYKEDAQAILNDGDTKEADALYAKLQSEISKVK